MAADDSGASVFPIGEEHLARGIVANAPDGIVVVDEFGLMVWANERLAAMLGYTVSELIGEKIEMLIAESLRDAHEQQREKFQEAPTQRPMAANLDLSARRKDGSSIFVEIALGPLVDYASGHRSIAIVRDITQRREDQEGLRIAEEARLLGAERDRIARDLHDTVIQRLFATGLTLQAAAAKAVAADVAEGLGEMVDEIDATIRQIRNAIFVLEAPPELASLRHSVFELISRSVRGMGFQPTVAFAGAVDTWTDEVGSAALLATLQEALSNVARHAQASRVDVEVSVRGGKLLLSVVDDGIGISPDRVGGSGIANMTTRAEALGGTIELLRGRVGGTTVNWTIPLDR